LERAIPDSDISEIAQNVYEVFEWLDDSWRAQYEKTVMLSGKKHRRIRYGKEPIPRDAPDEFKALWGDVITRPCHDCGVIQGEFQLDGCGMERCARRCGQYFCCDCRIEQDELESANQSSYAPGVRLSRPLLDEIPFSAAARRSSLIRS
jgi:hypothetical protein